MGIVVNAMALVYLILPIIIFAFGWLKSYYAILVTAVLLIAFFLSLKKSEMAEVVFDSRQRIKFLVLVGIVLLWVGLSGIGGLANQNIDHEARNAVLRDLIQFRWPLIYDFTVQTSSHVLASSYFLTHHQAAPVYYLTYWLPAALMGKLFGWECATVALYLWTVLGVLLSLYLFSTHIHKRISIILSMLFIFWSGLDVAGVLLKNHHFVWGEHLEWWAGYFQYSSNTTALFWVFNQSVPAWLALMLLLNQKNNKSSWFIGSLCFPYAPFPLIGMIPIVLGLSLFGQGDLSSNPGDVPDNRRDVLDSVCNNIKSLITFQNVVVPCVLLVFWGSYYLLNPSVGGNNRFSPFLLYANSDFFMNYGLFCLLEFGLYAVVIFSSYKKEPLFLIALLSLLLIPFCHGGRTNDFAMRVSIPALLILMVYVARYLFVSTNRFKIIVLIVLCLIGSITPLCEIYRSVHATASHYDQRLADHVQSLASLHNIIMAEKEGLFKANQVMRVDPKKTFFFKYFAKDIP